MLCSFVAPQCGSLAGGLLGGFTGRLAKPAAAVHTRKCADAVQRAIMPAPIFDCIRSTHAAFQYVGFKSALVGGNDPMSDLRLRLLQSIRSQLRRSFGLDQTQGLYQSNRRRIIGGDYRTAACVASRLLSNIPLSCRLL